jgi:hypothetical protein
MKQMYPDVTSKHLKYIIDNNITHDIKTPGKYNLRFNNKIVINHQYSYQMDIFVNNMENNTLLFSTSTIDPYYLILININTHYIELYHLQNRSSTSDKNTLKSIFNNLTNKSLKSDEEKSFVSSNILTYLKKHNEDYSVITE